MRPTSRTPPHSFAGSPAGVRSNGRCCSWGRWYLAPGSIGIAVLAVLLLPYLPQVGWHCCGRGVLRECAKGSKQQTTVTMPLYGESSKLFVFRLAICNDARSDLHKLIWVSIRLSPGSSMLPSGPTSFSAASRAQLPPCTGMPCKNQNRKPVVKTNPRLTDDKSAVLVFGFSLGGSRPPDPSE